LCHQSLGMFGVGDVSVGLLIELGHGDFLSTAAT
jgi:hypothetical protein